MPDKLRRIDETHRLSPGNSALVVIDMQHGFLDVGASLEVPNGRNAIPQIARLIDACRAKRMPVIFTEFVYATSIPCLRGDPFGPEHLPAAAGEATGYGHPSSNCLVGPSAGEGVESAKTIDALKPRDDELVLQAHTYDKFYGTHLDLALRSQNIDRLMITGVTTDVCVNATLMSAATRNYRVTAVTDAMATIHDHIHAACLEIWQNKFARLKTTREVLAEIGG
jgi:ureidoacrylate peracid hydrolase